MLVGECPKAGRIFNKNNIIGILADRPFSRCRGAVAPLQRNPMAHTQGSPTHRVLQHTQGSPTHIRVCNYTLRSLLVRSLLEERNRSHWAQTNGAEKAQWQARRRRQRPQAAPTRRAAGWCRKMGVEVIIESPFIFQREIYFIEILATAETLWNPSQLSCVQIRVWRLSFIIFNMERFVGNVF